jgi:hypothetical protein
MPFNKLSEKDKQAFMTRLAERGRAATIARDAKDIVVGEGEPVELSWRTAKHHRMELRRPASADELSKWIGVHPKLRENAAFQSSCLKDNAILEEMLRRTKLLEREVPEGKTLRHLLADDRDAQNAFQMFVRLYVSGRLIGTRRLLKDWPQYVLEEINRLTESTEVCFGTWVDIVIKSGGTLVFSPPGPYSVVAHSLTVEPGGKIITNAHVSYDCAYMTIL